MEAITSVYQENIIIWECLELQRGQVEESKNNKKEYRKTEKEEFLKNEWENMGDTEIHIEV